MIAFPNDPRKPRRKEWGNSLMKSVLTCSDRNYSLYLYRIKNFYPYQSIKSGLEEPWVHTEFREFSFKEPNRSMVVVICDGRLWKECWDKENQQQLSKEKGHLGVILNLDWFILMKIKSTVLVQYIWVYWISPRTERFQPENFLITGIILVLKSQVSVLTVTSVQFLKSCIYCGKDN